MRSIRTSLSVFLGLVVLGLSAWGSYPERPITLICPWAAGGGTDRISRMVANLLSQELGVPVAVVNRTGGSGVVGHMAGARAKPDGYTITMVTLEIATMHWLGLTDLTYADFEPVAQLNADYAAISVSVEAPWKTYHALHEYIRQHPGKLVASGTGVGGIWDIARAGWLRAAGFDINDVRWVPSKGAAPALQELVAGGVDLVTCSLAEAIPLIEAGQVRPLAFMGEERHPDYPCVPTLKELGIDWTCGTWRGIAVPKGTPPEVVKVLEEALAKIVQMEEFKEFMKQNGFGIQFRPAKEFGAFMANQDRVLGELLKALGLAK